MKRLLLAGVVALSIGRAGGVTLQLDYTYAGSFFTANPAAVTALERAAADLSDVLGPRLSTVPGDAFTGTAGFGGSTSSVSADWSLQFAHSSLAGNTVEVGTFSLATDVFRIYVGAQPLGSSVLGEGGPAGMGYELDASGFPSTIQAAATDLAGRSNAGLRGNAGPVMAEIPDSFTLGGTTVTYTLRAGALMGALTMNSAATWHFDLNTLPGPGQSDFYSVALHEMMHALGVGTAVTWADLTAGNDWLGANVGALTGGGLNVLDDDGAHIRSGLLSTNFFTGSPQEAAMDPEITTGTRKTLTALDVAFLADLGYAVVPEPGPLALIFAGLAILAVVARRRRAN